MEDSDSKSRINSVLRASQLIELLAHEGRETTLARAVQVTGLARPTVHRLLATLVEAGWVSRVSPGRYSLTPRFRGLVTSLSRGIDLRTLSGPILEELAEVTGQTAYLFVPDRDGALCISRVDGSFPIRVHGVAIGERLAFTAGAGPVALLAHRPELWTEVHIPAQLRPALEKAASGSHVVRSDDIAPGTTAVAAAVLDAMDVNVASVSVAGLTSRMQEPQQMEEIVTHVRSAAGRLAAQLGRTPQDAVHVDHR